jgi:hypothetical protein
MSKKPKGRHEIYLFDASNIDTLHAAANAGDPGAAMRWDLMEKLEKDSPDCRCGVCGKPTPADAAVIMLTPRVPVSPEVDIFATWICAEHGLSDDDLARHVMTMMPGARMTGTY